MDSSHIFILQWVKQLKQKPKSKVGKTRKSPRVPLIPVCYVESSQSNGKGVKSSKVKATGKSSRAAVKSLAMATRKSPRAAVKSPKAMATRKSPRATAKPVCQAICILPIMQFFQGILHLLYNPLIKLLVVVVTAGYGCILCRLHHRALWQVGWSCGCQNCWRVTATTRWLFFLFWSSGHILFWAIFKASDTQHNLFCRYQAANFTRRRVRWMM